MSKKTETIEIRLSPELKCALAQLSERQARSMSDLVRGLIGHAVAGTPIGTQLAGEPTMSVKSLSQIRPFRTFLYAVPILGLALTYLMSAQAPVTASPQVRGYFAELDANGDHQVTAPEYAAFLTAENFLPDANCATDPEEPCSVAEAAADEIAIVDLDGDGVVSFAEFEPVVMRDLAEAFLETDIDENGQITLDEMVAVIAFEEIADALENGESSERSRACQDLFTTGLVAGAIEACALDAEAKDLRIQLAEIDADRNGALSLREFLSY
ncbi:MAG: EF-hand domain-containing protein [Pseudomonadota bacterium]